MNWPDKNLWAAITWATIALCTLSVRCKYAQAAEENVTLIAPTAANGEVQKAEGNTPLLQSSEVVEGKVGGLAAPLGILKNFDLKTPTESKEAGLLAPASALLLVPVVELPEKKSVENNPPLPPEGKKDIESAQFAPIVPLAQALVPPAEGTKAEGGALNLPSLGTAPQDLEPPKKVRKKKKKSDSVNAKKSGPPKLFDFSDLTIEKMRPVESFSMRTVEMENSEEAIETGGIEVRVEESEGDTPLGRLLVQADPTEIPPVAFRRKGAILNRYYFVREGDTPKKIALQIYQNWHYKDDLTRWNSLPWDAGQALFYSSPKEPSDRLMKSFYEENSNALKTVVMEKSECLPAFAKRVLQNKLSWREIATINEIEERDYCVAGRGLKVHTLLPAEDKTPQKQKRQIAEEPSKQLLETTSDKTEKNPEPIKPESPEKEREPAALSGLPESPKIPPMPAPAIPSHSAIPNPENVSQIPPSSLQEGGTTNMTPLINAAVPEAPALPPPAVDEKISPEVMLPPTNSPMTADVPSDSTSDHARVPASELLNNLNNNLNETKKNSPPMLTTPADLPSKTFGDLQPPP